jgi:hypothetical protein
MCTVLLRLRPAHDWAVLLCAVRDEFLDRPWRPPGHHWGGAYRGLHGGLDEWAGGTWLAVDRSGPAVALVVNGPDGDPGPDPAGQSRGRLPLRALAHGGPPDAAKLAGTRGFHLLLATPSGVDVWSWDGTALTGHRPSPGDHTVTYHGVDAEDQPRVRRARALLRAAGSPTPRPGPPTARAWGAWTSLVVADAAGDPAALLQNRLLDGRPYGSTSVSLVALGRRGVRHDFTADPTDPDAWYEATAGTPTEGRAHAR